MKGLFKHFALITLLILHSSWGSVMAAQMLSTHLSMNGTETSISMPSEASQNTVATVDGNTENPCPHHMKNMTVDSSDKTSAMTDCNGHDCSNCTCVNVVSSIPSLIASAADKPKERSHALSMLTTVFPDSPPSSILRPPIS